MWIPHILWDSNNNQTSSTSNDNNKMQQNTPAEEEEKKTSTTTKLKLYGFIYCAFYTVFCCWCFLLLKLMKFSICLKPWNATTKIIKIKFLSLLFLCAFRSFIYSFVRSIICCFVNTCSEVSSALCTLPRLF